jgi:DNA-3-methyladenine glycosylase
MKRLKTSFFEQPTIEVARRLLGCRLVRRLTDVSMAGIIVETEAYLSMNDAASHSARGPTPRNRSMFGPFGQLYVYTIHTRFCMNIVTEAPGIGAAVLIRAIEPESGIERMLQNRPVSSRIALTNGPGKLCQALAIDRSLDGVDLIRGDLVWIEPGPSMADFSIRASSRIGIRQSLDLPLRFFVDGHRYVSGRAKDHSNGKHWSWNQ